MAQAVPSERLFFQKQKGDIMETPDLVLSKYRITVIWRSEHLTYNTTEDVDVMGTSELDSIVEARKIYPWQIAITALVCLGLNSKESC